jgi:hypothetical protein
MKLQTESSTQEVLAGLGGGGFKRGEDNPLDCDLLVVDETSMVDVMLMQALMKAAPDKAALCILHPSSSARQRARTLRTSNSGNTSRKLVSGIVR